MADFGGGPRGTNVAFRFYKVSAGVMDGEPDDEPCRGVSHRALRRDLCGSCDVWPVDIHVGVSVRVWGCEGAAQGPTPGGGGVTVPLLGAYLERDLAGRR